MKFIFFINLILLVQFSIAYARNSEAQITQDCVSCSENSTSKKIYVSLGQIGSFIDQIGDKVGWQNKCETFAKNEMIGPWGKFIRQEVRKSDSYSNFKKGDTDLIKLCPNFLAMTDNNKANVAVVLLTAMAFEESSCDNTATAKGPNGSAAGFLQLHLGKENDYSSNCSDYDSKTPEGSLSCGLSIIDKQMAQGPLFRQDKNYWDVLRPRRWVPRKKAYIENPSYNKIRNAIVSFPPCYDRSKMIEGRSISEVNAELIQAIDRGFLKRSPKKNSNTYDM